VPSLRDSPLMFFSTTRHFRAGLKFVSSLRDSGPRLVLSISHISSRISVSDIILASQPRKPQSRLR